MLKPLALMKTTLRSLIIVGLVCATTTLSAQALSEKRISHEEAKKLAIHAPRAEYPYVARRSRITGSGVVLVKVNTAGIVTSATMRQSTGSPILDRAAISSFREWRFKPGQAFFFWCPITFTMPSLGD